MNECIYVCIYVCMYVVVFVTHLNIYNPGYKEKGAQNQCIICPKKVGS